MKNKIEIKNMVLTASLLTIAIVLDLIMSFTQLKMPFGGSFFGISIIPLVFVGLFLGVKYGLIAGFLYAVYNFGADYLIYLDSMRITLEMWTGEKWTATKIILLVFFDYLLPFTAYGLAGLFKKSFVKKNQFILSFVIVSLIRWLSSTISGVVFWSSSITYATSQVAAGHAEANIATKLFALVGNNIWFYSLGYNFIYVFTTLVSSLVIGLSIYNRMALLKENHIDLRRN